MSYNGYSWWDLFLQILSFLIGKKKEEKRKEEQKKIAEELKNEYNKIDLQKEKSKNEAKDNINNLFK